MVCLPKWRMSRLAWIALAACLLAPCPCLAEEGLLLRYQHSPRDKAQYHVDITWNLRVEEEGGETAKVAGNLSLECLAECLGDTASGDWGILGTIVSGRGETTVDGEKESVEFGNIVARYIVSTRGEITSYRLIRGETPDFLHPDSGILLEPADAFLLSGMAVLPDKPVKEGEKWAGVAKIPFLEGGGMEELPYESTFLGVVPYRGSECWEIETTTKVDLEETIPGPDGFGQLALAVKVSGKATWLLDPKRGVLASGQEVENIALTVTFSEGGEKRVSATVAGVVNSRSELTEFNDVSVAPE